MSQPLLNPAPGGQALGRRAEAAETAGSRQRYLLGLWIFLAVTTPLVGFLGARGFAPTVGLAGLLCLPLMRPGRTALTGLALFSLLALWAVVSALWSPAPAPHSLKALGRFTGLHLVNQVVFSGTLITTAARLSPETARKALAWLGSSLLALAAILLVEALGDAWVFRSLQPLVGETVENVAWALRAVAQGGWALAALFWPAAVGLRLAGRAIALQALAIATPVVLLLLHASAPTVALGLSAVVFVLVWRFGRPAALGCMAFAAAHVLVVPWLVRGFAEGGALHALGARLPPSWSARVDIWTFTSARMAEKPLLGWGLDAARTFKGTIPLHPHDGPLQLWFELGLPGAVLGALIWGFIFQRFAAAAGRSRLYAAAGCATGTVCLVIGAFSFSLWQEWWIALSAFAFAAWVVLGRRFDAAPAA